MHHNKISRLRRWIALIAQFASGQIGIQCINLVTGFLIIRWLSVAAYAEYSVAFAFQSILGMLVDLGFSNSIVALVGDRTQDKSVVGSYIKSARHFRTRLFPIIALISVAVFPVITHKQNWPLQTKIALLTAIITSVYFQGFTMYSSPLLITRRLREYYRAQIYSSMTRTLAFLALHLSGILSAVGAAWISSASIAIGGLAYRKASSAFIEEPLKCDKACNDEMLKYIKPLVPGLIYTALQGQLSIALITYFGHTRSIAEIAALGRLSQLFIVLGSFNSVIVEPYIAQVSRDNLSRRYWQIAMAAAIIAVVVCILSFQFSRTLVLILGAKYHYLDGEVGWIVMAACISYFSGVLWTMNSARKWLFWSYTSLYIILTATVQIICIKVLDLSSTHSVIIYSIIVALVTALIHLVAGIYGLSNRKFGLASSASSGEVVVETEEIKA